MANVRIRDQGKLTLKDSDNSNEVSLQSPSTVAADQDFIVPNADGAANTLITTNASGTLSFTNINTLVASDIDWQTGAIKTGDFTAVAGKGFFVNTTSGTITATLPASPSAGDFVALKDYAGTFGTNKLTIDRNGSNIQGSANNSDLTTNRASVVLQYIDATKGWLYTVENNVGNLQPPYVAATGGTITTSGDFKIHTFTSSGTFTVTAPGTSDGSNTVDYLVVAGGGGGAGFGGCGLGGGGGGAGGYRESFPNPATGGTPVTAQAYPITVGGGGGASVSGSNSIFSSITSAGGGRGAVNPGAGTAGGSGGGASAGGAVGAGNTPPVSPSQGNNGGSGTGNLGITVTTGGGGGGKGGVGANSAGSGARAAGGSGQASSISASPVTYAGGGRGALNTDTSSNNGTANEGDGGDGMGGGGGNPAGSGGSGIVIIRYKYQN